MSFIGKQYRSIYGDMLLNFIWFGITNTLIGSLLPRILQDFRWTYAETGIILAGGSIAYFISTFLFGYLVRKTGLRLLTVSSLFLLGAANMVFGLFDSVIFNLAIHMLVGVGHGGLEVAVNTSVVRMERKEESHLMSYVHASFSVGAVLGPLLSGAILSFGGSWQISFRIMGLLFIASGLIPFVLPFERIHDGRTLPGVPAAGVFPGKTASATRKIGRGALQIVFLAALTVFLYVGMEVGISNWASEYFVSRFGIADVEASLVVALFWGGILAGRITIPLFARRASLTVQLLALSSTSAASVLLISLLPDPVSAGAGMFVAGLGFSNIYPLVMSLVGKHLTGDQSVGLGIVSTGGGVGAFAFPFVMALISQNLGIVSGFAFFAVTGCLLIASSTVLFFRVRTSGTPLELKT